MMTPMRQEGDEKKEEARRRSPKTTMHNVRGVFFIEKKNKKPGHTTGAKEGTRG
jgi:hypothetical protein